MESWAACTVSLLYFVTSRQADDKRYVSLLYHNKVRLKIRFSDNNLTTF
ncbi:hypothetical protein CLOSTASPAR_01766 [[Clostridium] asparagiforme DSM 15981]|uniref:Uncharacterized protein n=1 Tax=[Clostridium] asparagiforme DSM 15981 TaxID=518636 RepID=C0CXP1_9FIRM|nr:hypothetical protein CLOSTASPAR_01766 [[Clostridium] asparagiforme DSM 15981]